MVHRASAVAGPLLVCAALVGCSADNGLITDCWATVTFSPSATLQLAVGDSAAVRARANGCVSSPAVRFATNDSAIATVRQMTDTTAEVYGRHAGTTVVTADVPENPMVRAGRIVAVQ